MKPKPVNQKTKIKAAIATFIGMLRPGDQIRSEDVIKYVHKYIGRYIYGDTILRYMREMREDEKLNYTCVYKEDRIFRILEIGEPHSL